MTESEKNYVATVSAGHLKRYGQYFTSSFIADFMCAWACHGADSVLDPAVGNSVFLRCAQKRNQAAHLTGYEIDPIILEHFGNPARAEILLQDYLLGGWERRFDSIVCNPPYGERLSDRRACEELYAAMGRAFAKLGPWQIYVLSSHEDFESFYGRRADKVRKLYNGMIKCGFYQFFRPVRSE